ncbi:MAG TPA: TIGR03435 family protein [Bryobacteraceae bacterium]|nr:TIGR03435 family protein [Bryobacteraceae bacterium]
MKTILLLAISALAVAAQTPGFEVASIKPNQSGAGVSSIRGSTGRITMENVSLRKVALWAYGIPDDRDYALVGPDWMGIERFDIQATFPAAAGPEQVRQMTQKLLADRFQLTQHRESRERSIYGLVVAKNGPKIHAGEDGQSRTSSAPGRFEATKVTMAKFADLLAKYLGQQVTDATGLPGVFDFKLEWAPDDARKMPEDAVPDGTSGPSLFTALQEQLGLKLEGRKGPVEILVVDHMDRMPTGN